MESKYCHHCGERYAYSNLTSEEIENSMYFMVFTCGKCEKVTNILSQASLYELRIVDICLPDYFLGRDRATLAIPVYKDMTRMDFIDYLRTEWFQSDYMEDNGWFEMSEWEFEFLADKLSDNINDEMFSDLEERLEDSESVYCYIGLYKIYE